MGEHLLENYAEVVAVALFGIGFTNLLLQKNMIKKIIGLNIMDTAVYLFISCRKGIYFRTYCADCRKRRFKPRYLYQSRAKRACADRNRCVRIGYGPDAVAYHPAVPQIPYAGFG